MARSQESFNKKEVRTKKEKNGKKKSKNASSENRMPRKARVSMI